jgi:hypothetical protein
MPERTWRDEWSPFRVNLIDETARCMADQQAAATGGTRPGWAQLTRVQQVNVMDGIAGVFFAMDQAMLNLDRRGLVP